MISEKCSLGDYFHFLERILFKNCLQNFDQFKNSSRSLAPACGALVDVTFSSTFGHVLLSKKWSLGDLSNIYLQFEEFCFFKNMVMVMIVRVLTGFKRIFTSDPFKIPWQNDDLPPMFQYLIEN